MKVINYSNNWVDLWLQVSMTDVQNNAQYLKKEEKKQT